LILLHHIGQVDSYHPSKRKAAIQNICNDRKISYSLAVALYIKKQQHFNILVINSTSNTILESVFVLLKSENFFMRLEKLMALYDIVFIGLPLSIAAFLMTQLIDIDESSCSAGSSDSNQNAVICKSDTRYSPASSVQENLSEQFGVSVKRSNNRDQSAIFRGPATNSSATNSL
jgi:hypothetical protein